MARGESKTRHRGGKKRDRTQRAHAEKVHRRQRRAQNRRRIADLIRALTKGRVRPDPGLIDAVMARRSSEIRVVADQSLLDIGDDDVVLADVRRLLEIIRTPILPYQIRIPVRRFYSDYMAIIRVAKTSCAYRGKVRRAQVILAQHVLRHVDKNENWSTQTLYLAAYAALLRHWQMDGVSYFAEVEFEGETPIIRVKARRAIPTSFVRGGERRLAWLCEMFPGTQREVEWASWTAEERGAPLGCPPADVYLQSHALQKLRERLPLATENGGSLHASAYLSLRHPTLIPQGPKEWLAEFEVDGRRLGYFTAVEIDGRILVTTFLFLTMRDTPEGKRIRQRLGLRADQIEWLRMDTLPYFTQSDVAEDSEIRAILTECGCGHLFDIIEPEAREITLRGRARETRLHLGMPIPDFLPAFCSPVAPDGEESDEETQESDPDDLGQENDKDRSAEPAQQQPGRGYGR